MAIYIIEPIWISSTNSSSYICSFCWCTLWTPVVQSLIVSRTKPPPLTFGNSAGGDMSGLGLNNTQKCTQLNKYPVERSNQIYSTDQPIFRARWPWGRSRPQNSVVLWGLVTSPTSIKWLLNQMRLYCSLGLWVGIPVDRAAMESSSPSRIRFTQTTSNIRDWLSTTSCLTSCLLSVCSVGALEVSSPGDVPVLDVWVPQWLTLFWLPCEGMQAGAEYVW